MAAAKTREGHVRRTSRRSTLHAGTIVFLISAWLETVNLFGKEYQLYQMRISKSCGQGVGGQQTEAENFKNSMRLLSEPTSSMRSNLQPDERRQGF